MHNITHWTEGPHTAIIRHPQPAALAGAVLHGEGCHRAGAVGRAEVLRFRLPTGTAIIRRSRRGGVIRWFLTDAYLLRNRPLREFHVHAWLYDAGLAVPEPLAVAWERQGLAFRGAIATREVPGQTLLDYLTPLPVRPEDVLRRAGRVIREMHDAGVYHADLQLRNILVGPTYVYLIDFDGAVRQPRVSGLQRARNLLRLRRSFDKNYVPLRLFNTLCEGYGPLRIPRWLDWAYRIKGRLSDGMRGLGRSDP